MNDNPFNPNLRRVAPDDLPWAHTIPSATPSTNGSSPRPSAPLRPVSPCDCDGSGYYLLTVPVGHPEFGKLQRCACGRKADSVRAAARLGDELGDLAHCTFDAFDLSRPLAPIWTLANRYYRSLDPLPPADRHQAECLTEAIQRPLLAAAYDRAWAYAICPRGWLCLHGAYGGGKSHLAAAIAHHLVAQGWSVRYRSVPGMLDAIKAGFKDGSSDAVFDDLLMCDLLVLDDLGAQHISGYNYERLFRLINERLHKPTVITTNVHPDDLGDSNDIDAARLASRIAGAAQSIWLPISDYRRLAKQVPS